MSLVEEGILILAELVQESGVSEAATRRYLQKAGYKIMEGTISLTTSHYGVEEKRDSS